jgi:hypothetical protein
MAHAMQVHYRYSKLVAGRKDAKRSYCVSVKEVGSSPCNVFQADSTK